MKLAKHEIKKETEKPQEDPVVPVTDDLPEIERLLGDLLKKLSDSPNKSRYRSLIITHLEIAEGFLEKEKKAG